MFYVLYFMCVDVGFFWREEKIKTKNRDKKYFKSLKKKKKKKNSTKPIIFLSF